MAASTQEQRLIEFLSQFVSVHKLQLFDEVVQQRTRHVTIVLEDLFRPQNASACLRSCEAFGVQDVHAIENRHRFRVDREVALGGARWLTLHRHNEGDDNTRSCLESLRREGYRLLATVPRDDALPMHEVRLDQKVALMFGHEKEGLTPMACEMADEFVTIPMHGFTHSFNVSVAAAVSLYELTTRLRQSEIDWRLTAEEMVEIRAAWIRRAVGYRLPFYEKRFREEVEAG